MPIYHFKAVYENTNTKEIEVLIYISCISFIESWEKAIDYFNSQLLKKDKYWIYKNVTVDY